MSRTVRIDRLQRQQGQFRLGPVSFAVPAGGRLAVVGPSGSGKTTLLRCIAGLDQPSAGAIHVGDADATRLPPDRRHLGMVFQDGALWPHMTALQHLTFAAPGMSKHDALALLRQGGIEAQADKRPGAMSGGEAQRLGLLRALAPAPDVLLLDEPLRSVDVHQRDGLVLLVRSLCDQRGVTTILVTHDRDEALSLADTLVVMRGGQLVEQGAASELLERPRTAFTAAFLRGAACMPAADEGERVRTPFGAFARDGRTGDLRLVLFPGDAEADDAADGPEARVLATLPGDDGLRLRVACQDQLLIVRAAAAPTAATTRLRLCTPPRLLPWHDPEESSR